MKTVTAEKVGLSSTRLQRISIVMQDYVDQHKLAGIITMLARRGEVVHFECFGMMDIEADKPMQPDTIFRLYSMTKPITSVAVMMLYEEGHFQLYDSVSKYIPEFKGVKVFVKATPSGVELVEPEREMTLQDLLRHTSGITYDFLDQTAVGDLYRHSDMWQAGNLGEFVQKLAKLPLAAHPGTRWQYGLSFDVLGYLVEVLSGISFDKFLEERIFKPLGMVDTAFWVPPEKRDRLAAMYGPAEEGGGLKLIDAPQASAYLKPPSAPFGGGGLVGTASDYMRFAQMMLNGGALDGIRLLSRKTVELMTTNHLPQQLLPFVLTEDWKFFSEGYGYGLGFDVLMDVAQSRAAGSVGAFGWGGAASTDFWVDPKEELIGLILPQFQPILYYPFAAQFNALAYQAIVD
jgi:CubicO group peptidase (beta-lactamase class C family)